MKAKIQSILIILVMGLAAYNCGSVTAKGWPMDKWKSLTGETFYLTSFSFIAIPASAGSVNEVAKNFPIEVIVKQLEKKFKIKINYDKFETDRNNGLSNSENYSRSYWFPGGYLYKWVESSGKSNELEISYSRIYNQQHGASQHYSVYLMSNKKVAARFAYSINGFLLREVKRSFKAVIRFYNN